MNIENMTPEEIRSYAARKEAAELHLSHIGADAAVAPAGFAAVDGGLEPWERAVEVDGVRYTVDMRRLKSRRFVRMAVEANAEDAPMLKKFDLFDYIFEPMSEQIAQAVVRKMGYEDFEEYYRICSEIFEALGIKN